MLVRENIVNMMESGVWLLLPVKLRMFHIHSLVRISHYRRAACTRLCFSALSTPPTLAFTFAASSPTPGGL